MVAERGVGQHERACPPWYDECGQGAIGSLQGHCHAIHTRAPIAFVGQGEAEQGVRGDSQGQLDSLRRKMVDFGAGVKGGGVARGEGRQ